MIKKNTENLFIICLILFSYLFFHFASAGLVSSFSDALSRQTIATAADHSINFTISSAIGPDETLELFFESGFDLSLVDFTDIDFKVDGQNKNLGAGPGIGTDGNIGAVISNQTIIFTQNDTNNISAGSVITILIGIHSDFQQVGDKQIYNPDIAGTYKISISGTFGDYGTLSIQILNTDTVGFSGIIEPSLSFVLRNSEDTAPAMACNFGIVSLSTVAQCSYRLAIETNNPKGFQLWIGTDGNLRNVNGNIANIPENSTVSAGTEAYGLSLQSGTGITEVGYFNDDDTPVPVENSLLISTNSVYNYIQGDLSTSSLVTLKIAASSSTPAGSYSQLITYTILGNF